jgi:hypothetical protein
MKNSVKRIRPPMPPLAVRVQVAERQLTSLNAPHARSVLYGLGSSTPLKYRLIRLLQALRWAMGLPQDAKLALDHDPALILRPYNPRIKDVARRYIPHAHDPDALLYREKANHQQKTTGRRPGAERTITVKGSDVGLMAKFARLEREPRRKAKIAQRKNPWPKRKMR